MSHMVAQVTFQSSTGLSKDRFENVWHFIGNSPTIDAQECATAIGRLAGFYTTEPPAMTSALGSSPAYKLSDYLSSAISRTVTVKVYDGSVTPAGPPALTGQFTLPAAAATTNIPEEVALCLSYFTAVNTPRHRGRIYIGPFNTTALGSSTSDTSGEQLVRPDPHLIQVMSYGGEALAANGDGVTAMASILNLVVGYIFLDAGTFDYVPVSGVNWALRSGVGTGTKAAPVPTWSLVLNGWVDNEWDSQRRRRVEASARQTFAG